MKHHVTRAAVLAVLALLAACGPPQPVFRTDYQLVPPASENGRMCATNCIMAKQNCQTGCGLQSQQCVHNNRDAARDAERDARRSYENYARDRKAQGKLVKRSVESFNYYSPQDCDMDGCAAMCEQNFHLCYSTCGGQVIPQTSCVANCHLLPPPTPVPALAHKKGPPERAFFLQSERLSRK